MGHPEPAGYWESERNGLIRWMYCEWLRFRATAEFVDDLNQAAASRQFALGFQCGHRVSTSAPRSFLATRSLRVRSMF
jgi:hypothetical protein